MKDKLDNKTIDAFEKKALTNAERQRKYRENNKIKNEMYRGEVRLDLYISHDAMRDLNELVKLHGNTKKETLEKIISEMRYLESMKQGV